MAAVAVAGAYVEQVGHAIVNSYNQPPLQKFERNESSEALMIVRLNKLHSNLEILEAQPDTLRGIFAQLWISVKVLSLARSLIRLVLQDAIAMAESVVEELVKLDFETHKETFAAVKNAAKITVPLFERLESMVSDLERKNPYLPLRLVYCGKLLDECIGLWDDILENLEIVSDPRMQKLFVEVPRLLGIDTG